MPCAEGEEENERESKPSRFKFTPRKAIAHHKEFRAERARVQERERTVKIFAEREARVGERERLQSRLKDVREERQIQKLRADVRGREARAKAARPRSRKRKYGTFLGKAFGAGIRVRLKTGKKSLTIKKYPKGRKRRVRRKMRGSRRVRSRGRSRRR